MQEENIVELVVTPSQRWYPKGDKLVEVGAWQIFSAKVMENPNKEYIDYNFRRGEITIVGNLPFGSEAVYENDNYKIRAIKKWNDKYNAYQYEVAYCQLLIPLETIADKRAFLSSFLTERQINNLYEALEDPFTCIAEMNVEELCKASGIGEKTAQSIIDKFLACQDEGSQFTELVQLGLTPNIVRKLKEYYKSIDTALHKVKTDPYSLVEVDGVGFAKADEIALKVGIGTLDTKRVRGYVLHHFQEEADKGHCYSPMSLLEDKVEEVLGLQDMCILDDVIEDLINKKKLLYIRPLNEEDEGLIALQKNYNIELSIYNNIKRLMEAPSNINLDQDKALQSIKQREEKQGWEFTDQQKEGMFTIADHNVVIIRGYAGTGKSSCVAGILACLDESYHFEQCALSGRASSNLFDITGKDGKTIHRLLGYKPEKGFAHDETNPIKTNMVILDEASMVDANLFNSLIQAIPTGAKLIMLGDTNQLEAIGMGNVMLDMIDSEEVPVITFDKIHRQGAKSGIIPFSKDIAEGVKHFKDSWEGAQVLGELQDLKVIGYQSNKDEEKPSIDLIVDEFKEMYQECKDISQVSVVVPTKSRGTGCYPINLLLQNIVLPRRGRGKCLELGTKKEPFNVYRGDKVINRKNNYELNIFNGSMGEVIEVNEEQQTLLVDFYNIGQVLVKGESLKSIELAYAISCHSAQGSGFPYLIYCVDYTHFSLLTRQQVYTGITRAKKRATFIFETRALNRAIRTNHIVHKRTFLYSFLTNEINENNVEIICG
jgi:exodeoxyribonuclease V alpha subunit